MNSLRFQLAVLLAVPLFTLLRIRRSRSREFGNGLQSLIQPSVPPGIAPASASSCLHGSAPLYVLEGDLGLTEVA